MPEPGHRLRLALESLGAESDAQQLHRDLAIEHAVVRCPDLPHPAFPQQPLDGEPPELLARDDRG